MKDISETPRNPEVLSDTPDLIGDFGRFESAAEQEEARLVALFEPISVEEQNERSAVTWAPVHRALAEAHITDLRLTDD